MSTTATTTPGSNHQQQQEQQQEQQSHSINHGLLTLNQLERKMAAVLLRKCCSSSAWVEEMVVNRPYLNFDAVKKAALITTKDMSSSDWHEGFSGSRLDFSSNNNSTLQQLKDTYLNRFSTPYFLDPDRTHSIPTIISDLRNVLNDPNTTTKAQQQASKLKFMKACIRKLANVLASLGDKDKAAGFHQARIESSLLQTDVVPKLDDCHPARAQFWNGTRLKGLLEWDYEKKDVLLWGGLNYHQSLPEKVNHINHFGEGGAAQSTRATASKKKWVDPVGTIRQNFFGGSFR
jgi:hypothetical protein